MRLFKNVHITSCAVALVVLLATGTAFGQPSKGRRQNSEQQLRFLEDEWLSCYVSGDKTTYDRLVADEFVGTDESAIVRSKADDRALLPAKSTPGASAVNEDVSVRDYESFAVVTGRIVTRFRIGDKEIGGFKTRFTDTWIKRKGEWKVAARHYSRLPVERVAVMVDAAVFDEYKGTYELGPGMEVNVSREGSKLFGEFPGPSKLELLPESDQVFFSKIPPALFIFLRDKTGRIARLITIQDGRVTPAAKIR